MTEQTKQHTFQLKCPACGGTALANRNMKQIICSYCGSDLVVDPHSAIGQAVTLQSLLSIPGEIRQLEARRMELSQTIAGLKRGIQHLNGEKFYTGLRIICAIIAIVLIYSYGTALIGTAIARKQMFPTVPRPLLMLLTPAPIVSLFVYKFPGMAGIVMAIPVIGFIIAQSKLMKIPDETRDELESKLAAALAELQEVNMTILERQRTIDLYRDVIPRLMT